MACTAQEDKRNRLSALPPGLLWKRCQLGVLTTACVAVQCHGLDFSKYGRQKTIAQTSGLKMQHCQELWCRSQMRLGSHIAVAMAVASSYSSDLIPSLGTSIGHRCSPKKTKKKKKKKRWVLGVPWWHGGLRIWCCHFGGMASIPSQELAQATSVAKKKKKERKKEKRVGIAPHGSSPRAFSGRGGGGG